MRHNSAARTLVATAAVLMTTGCAGLRVEPSLLAAHGQRLKIPMVANATLERGPEELLTDVLIEAFARDGRVRVVETAPDLILDATLVAYRLGARDFDEDQRIVGRHVDVTVTAAILDARSGEIVLPERAFSSSGSFFAAVQPSFRRESDVFVQLSQAMISSFIEGW